MILATMALPAHAIPEITARILEKSFAPAASTATIKASPANARITASHSRPLILSPRIGQARRITQNGIV